MKKAFSLILFLLTMHLSLAQEIPLSEVNSNNILDFYSQISKESLTPTKGTLATQVGENNYIEISDSARANLTLLQYGNNNATIYNNWNSYPANAEISIKGSNNLINIEGSNSISDGMKMNINADDMTIFMRNQ